MSTSSPTSPRRADARTAFRRAAELDDAQPDVAAPRSRIRLLERAVRLLSIAAKGGDKDLAQACRDVLDDLDLPSRSSDEAAPAGRERTSAPACTVAPTPPTPPEWASVSVPDDGGITHEAVSRLRPTIRVGGVNGWDLMPTDVCLSVTDMLIDGLWIRTQPVIHVEGGGYSLDGVRHLQAALDAFVMMVETKASAVTE